MKSKKNKIISAAIFLIVILSVFFFIAFNFGVFDKRKDVEKKGIAACLNLDLNDNCSFLAGPNQVTGKCSIFRNKDLICKPDKQNR